MWNWLWTKFTSKPSIAGWTFAGAYALGYLQINPLQLWDLISNAFSVLIG